MKKEEIIKEFREKFDEYRYKLVPKDMDVPMIEVENFILQKLAEQEKEFKKILKTKQDHYILREKLVIDEVKREKAILLTA